MHFSGRGSEVLLSDLGIWASWGQSQWYHWEEYRRLHAVQGYSGL